MDSDWKGDLDDDCSLERYGMLAHVECMDRGVWWFGISRGKEELYNTTDVRLTTGKAARAAAEAVMEVLRGR